MEIRVLRYFLAVAQEENITRAAEKLHIAQPSLSKQLMELEDELGKQLLIRGKRRIILTEEGVRCHGCDRAFGTWYTGLYDPVGPGRCFPI